MPLLDAGGATPTPKRPKKSKKPNTGLNQLIYGSPKGPKPPVSIATSSRNPKTYPVQVNRGRPATEFRKKGLADTLQALVNRGVNDFAYSQVVNDIIEARYTSINERTRDRYDRQINRNERRISKAIGAGYDAAQDEDDSTDPSDAVEDFLEERPVNFKMGERKIGTINQQVEKWLKASEGMNPDELKQFGYTLPLMSGAAQDEGSNRSYARGRLKGQRRGYNTDFEKLLDYSDDDISSDPRDAPEAGRLMAEGTGTANAGVGAKGGGYTSEVLDAAKDSWVPPQLGWAWKGVNKLRAGSLKVNQKLGLEDDDLTLAEHDKRVKKDLEPLEVPVMWSVDKLSRPLYGAATSTDYLAGEASDSRDYSKEKKRSGLSQFLHAQIGGAGALGISPAGMAKAFVENPVEAGKKYAEGVYGGGFGNADNPTMFGEVIANEAKRNPNKTIQDNKQYQIWMGLGADIAGDPINLVGLGLVKTPVTALKATKDIERAARLAETSQHVSDTLGGARSADEIHDMLTGGLGNRLPKNHEEKAEAMRRTIVNHDTLIDEMMQVPSKQQDADITKHRMSMEVIAQKRDAAIAQYADNVGIDAARSELQAQIKRGTRTVEDADAFERTLTAMSMRSTFAEMPMRLSNTKKAKDTISDLGVEPYLETNGMDAVREAYESGELWGKLPVGERSARFIQVEKAVQQLEYEDANPISKALGLQGDSRFSDGEINELVGVAHDLANATRRKGFDAARNNPEAIKYNQKANRSTKVNQQIQQLKKDLLKDPENKSKQAQLKVAIGSKYHIDQDKAGIVSDLFVRLLHDAGRRKVGETVLTDENMAKRLDKVEAELERKKPYWYAEGNVEAGKMGQEERALDLDINDFDDLDANGLTVPEGEDPSVYAVKLQKWITEQRKGLQTWDNKKGITNVSRGKIINLAEDAPDQYADDFNAVMSDIGYDPDTGMFFPKDTDPWLNKLLKHVNDEARDKADARFTKRRSDARNKRDLEVNKRLVAKHGETIDQKLERFKTGFNIGENKQGNPTYNAKVKVKGKEYEKGKANNAELVEKIDSTQSESILKNFHEIRTASTNTTNLKIQDIKNLQEFLDDAGISYPKKIHEFKAWVKQDSFGSVSDKSKGFNPLTGKGEGRLRDQIYQLAQPQNLAFERHFRDTWGMSSKSARYFIDEATGRVKGKAYNVSKFLGKSIDEERSAIKAELDSNPAFNTMITPAETERIRKTTANEVMKDTIAQLKNNKVKVADDATEFKPHFLTKESTLDDLKFALRHQVGNARAEAMLPDSAIADPNVAKIVNKADKKIRKAEQKIAGSKETYKKAKEAQAEATKIIKKRLREDAILRLADLDIASKRTGIGLKFMGNDILKMQNPLALTKAAEKISDSLIVQFARDAYAASFKAPSKGLPGQAYHIKARREGASSRIVADHISYLKHTVGKFDDVTRIQAQEWVRKSHSTEYASNAGKNGAEAAREVDKVYEDLVPYFNGQESIHGMPLEIADINQYLSSVYRIHPKNIPTGGIDGPRKLLRAIEDSAEFKVSKGWLKKSELKHLKDPLEVQWNLRIAVEQALSEKALKGSAQDIFGVNIVDLDPKLYKKLKKEGYQEIQGMPNTHLYSGEAAPMMNALLETLKPHNTSELGKIIDTATRTWKASATIYNPGYYVRNGIGEVMISWFFGLHNPYYYRQAAKTMKYARGDGKELEALKKHNPMLEHIETKNEVIDGSGIATRLSDGTIVTHQDALIAFHDAGLSSTFANTEFAHNMQLGQSKLRNSVPGKVAGTIHGGLRKAGEGEEQYLRMAHFLFAMKKSGKNNLKAAAESAASEVRKAHFDYNDFNDFEKMTMMRVFPFYKWTRKALPLMTEMLFLKPGKTLVYSKGMNALSDSLSTGDIVDDENGFMPDYHGVVPAWMQDMWLYQIDDMDGSPLMGKVNTPQLDALGAANNPDGTAFGMANPLAKIPAQQYFGTTGGENFGGWNEDVKTKEERIKNGVSSVPLARFLNQLRTGDAEDGRKLSFLTGLGFYENTPERQEAEEYFSKQRK